MTVADERGTPTEVVDLEAVIAGPSILRAEWNALAQGCAGTSYFQSADWIWSWWESVARRPPTRVACWRSPDGTLVAVAAVSAGRVMLHRRMGISLPATTLAGTGPGDADHCGAVAMPHRRVDVARWLRGAVGRRTLVAEALDPDDGIEPLGARHLERMTCPRLDLSAEASPGPSTAYRAQLRKYARRIARAGVRFEVQPAGTVAPATVDALLELHGARQRSLRSTSTLGPLHRDLLLGCCDRADDERGPVAVVVRKGAEVIGVLLGFRWQRTFALYQKGWDPTYAPFSLGSLLVAEAIHDATASGVDTVDFLRGTEPYKFRFGATKYDDRTMIVPKGATGALLVARAAALARRDRVSRRGAAC